MEPGTPLMALRVGSERHALEPGRDYLLGSAESCDLRIAGAAPVHARLSVTEDGATVTDLDSELGLLHNEVRVESASLVPGDRIALAGELLVVIEDDGTSTLVPIPALRAAATQRRTLRVRAAAAALRHQERTFAELVASGLRDAPWLALSLLLHLLLVLLLAVNYARRDVSGDGVATIRLDVAAGAPRGEAPPAPPEVVVDQSDDEWVEDPDPLAQEEPAPIFDGPTTDRPRLTENPTLTPRKRRRNGGAGRGAIATEGGVGSGSFREKVAELQESGLEIVFVFDSTGSMTRTIQDTKATIVEMCDVLRALVPDARVGLVTYRDHGPREDYVVREVPLGHDPWRASNFVQHVTAEGGGDRPEAVGAGLEAAMQQAWRSGGRRVIVLAGDAPTHERELRGLLREVKKFSADNRSFVHTLVTTPDRAGDDTFTQFERIAARGNGVCELLDNSTRVLQRVLTLAFGREFDDDVDEVVRSVNRRRDRVDTAALHLVRRAGPQLAVALRQQPVPPTLWNALVRKPRAAVATVLIDLLKDRRTPAHTRHAAAAALQRMLELDLPPIDPQTAAPPSKALVRRLRRLAERLPS